MTYLLWIDPGLRTGVALGRFDDDTPYELLKAWHIENGVSGVRDWFLDEELYVTSDAEVLFVGAEKFTPRPNPKGGGLSLKSAEPLRIEGWLVGEGILPDYPLEPKSPVPANWQHPPAMYFAGGKDQPEKKKRMHGWLKAHDLYVTGKQLDSSDADDARSAIAHSIAYLRGIQHMPTLRHYFKD